MAIERRISRRVRSLGLLSGGLDSMLAVKVLVDQGTEVTGLSFQTPFFSPQNAIKAANELGIPLVIQDITEEHLKIVKKPPSGYGANMNPCIDCHALMIREAGKKMEEEGHDFVFTGEVLNERPMSQTRRSLLRVAKLSGYGDCLLRPLSAKLLPETKPERDGLVDRERLLDIEGRSRKRQLALARKYGLKEFPTPAGGCLLTDPNFSKRLKELFRHNKKHSIRDIELLKVGRHFRVSGIKAVVGRNEQENQMLKNMATESDIVLSAEHVPGPIGLICGGCSNDLVEIVAGICIRHSDKKNDIAVPAMYILSSNRKEVSPRPVSADAIDSWRI